MRYAILSDIHSNLEALSAVLSDLATQRIDRYLCLGDLVGYGADPARCLARLQGIGAVSVCGNHDWACVGKVDVRSFNSLARQAVEWTRDRLSVGELDLLRRLSPVLTEGPLTLVHGTLKSPERFEYLVDLAQAVETVTLCRTPYCAVGHTHVPLYFEYDLDRQRIGRVVSKEAELRAIVLPPASSNMRCVVNPGSIGQPRDGDPRACVAILDEEQRSYTVRHVPYDIPSAQRKILEAGLPPFLAERLAVGR